MTTLPLEVHEEQTVSIEKLIETESEVELATRAGAQQEKKDGKGISEINMDEKADMEKDTAFHKEEDLKEKAEV